MCRLVKKIVFVQDGGAAKLVVSLLMSPKLLCIPLAVLALVLPAAAQEPQFTSSNELIRPENYREWIYLSSGLGMTYGPNGNAGRGNPLFDNVFVSPAAYQVFKATGKWPEKTIFILEVRSSESHGSINRDGHFQSDTVAIEAEVKDSARFPDKWAYFNLTGAPGAFPKSAKAFPAQNGCFACHTKNAAVENTFTQFYPAALEIAEAKGTLNASYPRPAPTPGRFYQLVAAEGWDKAKPVYQEAKAKYPDASLFQESSLNRLGYQFLQAGRKDEAIQMMKLAAESYAQSANAWDSLAEACEAAGRKSEAIAASEKVLAVAPADPKLNPESRAQYLSTARDRLKRLKAS